MKKLLIILLIIILALGLGFGGFIIYKTHTPEYALSRTIKDVNESGMEGLKKHLTDNAANLIDSVADASSEIGTSNILTGFTKDLAISYLKTKMSEVKWTVKDILRGKSRSDVIIGFDYNGTIVGSIGIILVKDGGEWKIDSLEIPDFETFDLW